MKIIDKILVGYALVGITVALPISLFIAYYLKPDWDSLTSMFVFLFLCSPFAVLIRMLEKD